MYKKPYSSPPTGYGPPGDGYDLHSAPLGSFYVEDVPQHFYKWNSPPGVVKILEGLGVLLCITIFACVASTLAWEYNYGYGGLYGSGLGGYYGSGYYSGGMGYGGYGGYGGMTNPRAANGLMIAMAVLCFITLLGLFVASVAKSSSARSRRFYLAVIVVCAILAFVMLIASIVYIMGVNPRAQMTGSYYYNPMLTMCNQMYSSGGNYLNQYLYHYCTVDPQEAIAIVCGFFIVILLCVICFFAHKTRHKIWKYGKPNIYWDKPPAYQEGPNVEEWVGNPFSGEKDGPEFLPSPRACRNRVPSSQVLSDTGPAGGSRDPPRTSRKTVCGCVGAGREVGGGLTSQGTKLFPPKTAQTSSSFSPGKRLHQRSQEGKNRRTDPGYLVWPGRRGYSGGGESGDPVLRCPVGSVYPPITSDGVRQEYKQEFDADLKHYKQLCAEMDDINDQLNQLSKQLDGLSEDSPQYQGVAEEYNRLKDLKRTPGYQTKKLESKALRNKLFHIKRMVSDYDKMRG
uniref:Occludin n=1 Tax=Pelodiscus sinensis TaxID=13735 RepID=K7G322_PELSI